MAKKKAKKAAKKAVVKPSKKKPVAKAAKKPAAKAVKKPVKKAAKKPVKKAASKKPAAQVLKKSTTVNAYLNFNGNCEEAFNFYQSVFGGKFGWVSRFSDMPPMEGKSIPESEGKKIMHISLPISQETILMGSDTSESLGHHFSAGNNFSLSLNTVSQAEADRLFNSLSAGGHAIMPMEKTFWGSYFGMLTDKFGINWMISFETGQKA